MTNFEDVIKTDLTFMDDFRKKNGFDVNDKDIVFSKSVKAGKRIYYLDVKKNRKNEFFLAITESKKVVSGDGEAPSVSFEKHKIFLYKEDFDKFICGLQEMIDYINNNQINEQEFGRLDGEKRQEESEFVLAEEIKGEKLNNKIEIDFDFE